MKVNPAELKICLATWQKHLSDSIKQRDLLKAQKNEEAKQFDVSIGELYALDVHCLDLLRRILPDDSELIRKWYIYKENLMMDDHIKVADYKIGALKLALNILEGSVSE